MILLDETASEEAKSESMDALGVTDEVCDEGVPAGQRLGERRQLQW